MKINLALLGIHLFICHGADMNCMPHVVLDMGDRATLLNQLAKKHETSNFNLSLASFIGRAQGCKGENPDYERWLCLKAFRLVDAIDRETSKSFFSALLPLMDRNNEVIIGDLLRFETPEVVTRVMVEYIPWIGHQRFLVNVIHLLHTSARLDTMSNQELAEFLSQDTGVLLAVIMNKKKCGPQVYKHLESVKLVKSKSSTVSAVLTLQCALEVFHPDCVMKMIDPSRETYDQITAMTLLLPDVPSQNVTRYMNWEAFNEPLLRAIILKYGYQKIYEIMSHRDFGWRDYFQLALWAPPGTKVRLGRCFTRSWDLEDWKAWVDKCREINPILAESLLAYNSEIKPALIIDLFKTHFDKQVENNAAKAWIEKSKFLSAFDLGFLEDAVALNQRSLLRTICCLEPDNPFMKIDKEALISKANVGGCLNEIILLKQFADGLGDIMAEEALAVLNQGYFFNPIANAMAEALIHLRLDANEECPIPREKLDELVYTFLIGQLASAKQQYNEILIKGISINERLVLPAHFIGHQIAVEVFRKSKDEFVVTILNSGTGLRYHRGKGERFEFFMPLRMDMDTMGDKYFFSNSFNPIDICFHNGYGPKLELLDRSQEPKDIDTYGRQKHGNCTAKAASLMVKWILKRDDATDKYGHHLWFKAWHISYRAKDLRRVLSKRVVTKEKLFGLEKKWEGLNVDLYSLDEVMPESEVIILHHVMRILSESKKLKDDTLRQAIVKTLQSVELPSASRNLFERAQD